PTRLPYTTLFRSEHQQVVIGRDQHQHEEHKQVKVCEEAIVAGIAVHVADGVDMNDEAHTGDDEEHHGTQWISQETDLDAEWPSDDPIEEHDLGRLRISDDGTDDEQRKEE